MAEDLWNDVSTVYDRSFATLCAGAAPALVERVPPGSDVLDVGCGSGHLAAALLAAGHRVTAVDPDPGMVGLTRSRTGLDPLVGGLPDLPVQEPADVVVAAFVLNHVDDPRAAAAGIAPVVRPGGRVLATIWGTTPPPQAVLWNRLLDGAGAVRPVMPRLAPDLDFPRSPDGLAGLLAGAGLEPADAGTVGWTWRVRPDDLWAGLTGVGNFGVAWRAQSAEVQRRMRASYDEECAPWRDGDVLALDVECVLVEVAGR